MFQKVIFSKGSTDFKVLVYPILMKAKQESILDNFVVLSGIAMK
jgi:hypothetical protein